MCIIQIWSIARIWDAISEHKSIIRLIIIIVIEQNDVYKLVKMGNISPE